MPDFYVNGKRVDMKEPWIVFTVYGNFLEPATGKTLILVRIPSGKVPWSKKIVPAIQRELRKWPREDDDKLWWNTDGEYAVFIGENYYTDTNNLIPETRRLWDITSLVKYEWNGEELKRVYEPKKRRRK